MIWQAGFALGCGFSTSKFETLNALRPLTTTLVDRITLYVFRGLQGVGAAAVIPSAVSRIAIPTLTNGSASPRTCSV